MCEQCTGSGCDCHCKFSSATINRRSYPLLHRIKIIKTCDVCQHVKDEKPQEFEMDYKNNVLEERYD